MRFRQRRNDAARSVLARAIAMAAERSAHVTQRFAVTVLTAVLLVTHGARAQSAEPTARPSSDPDVARVRVALVAALRTCIATDGWTLSVSVTVDPRSGRLRIVPASGVNYGSIEMRCLQRAAARARGPRRGAGEPWTVALTLEGRDPREELLRTVDVRACMPTYDPGRCHLNVAVVTNARRPQTTAAVTWDVQGCVPTAEELSCLEASIGHIAWPVNSRDDASFRGRIGPGS